MVGLVARNVTYLYLKYRTEHKNKKNRFGSSILGGYSSTRGESAGQQRLLTQLSEDEGDIEMTQHLPPVWVDIVDDCRDDVDRIKDKMSQLQKGQQKRLLKVFDDDGGEGHPDRDLDGLTIAITQLFKKSEHRLRDIKVRTPGFGNSGAGPALNLSTFCIIFPASWGTEQIRAQSATQCSGEHCDPAAAAQPSVQETAGAIHSRC
eukprot:GHVS01076998.1.p1 GENE.GHVS01076998.1~~GHVS01076998.1.p1  ORF type:complete len:205 (-),score=25.51 GHVS01076998.1:596-1210(-)